MHVEQPTRPETLWFEDGNIVFQAGNTQYRLYRGTLARHSSVFKDMLSFPQPIDAEMVEECPLVRLPDPEAQVTPFFRALFDPTFFSPFPSRTDFPTIYGCLRLSHKYEVGHLRQRALVHLSSRFRTSRKQHEELRYLCSEDIIWQEPTAQISKTGSWKWPWGSSAFLVSVIQLARETGALWVMPAAFYKLAADMSSYRRSAMRDENTGATLDLQEQINLSQGSEEQTRRGFRAIQILQRQTASKHCASPRKCLSKRLEVVQQGPGLEDILADPLDLGPDDWSEDCIANGVCAACMDALGEQMRDALNLFWDDLPGMYGLPAWDQLEKLREAEIGDAFKPSNDDSLLPTVMPPRRRPKKKPAQAPVGPPRRIRALEIEDIVENIVEHAFLDREDEEGVINNEALPKRFVTFALVSRSFVNPVRRCLYGDLTIEGPDRFLLLTGQLRFSPQLAKFVKEATLRSACQAASLEGDHAPMFLQTPGQDEPRTMSALALKWFLDACPQLTRLYVYGGDFAWPLTRQDPKGVKLTHVHVVGCFRCRGDGPGTCWNGLRHGGWLKNVLAFPKLVELEVDHIDFRGGNDDPTKGLAGSTSVATELTMSLLQQRVAPHSLGTLLRAMPKLRELALDGLTEITPEELKICFDIVAKGLTLFSVAAYSHMRREALMLDDSFFNKATDLEQLALNDILLTPTILDHLPPKLKLLRFSGAAVGSLDAPAIIKWLKSKPFPLPALKDLTIYGELHDRPMFGWKPATDGQKSEISELCSQKGIKLYLAKDALWGDFGGADGFFGGQGDVDSDEYESDGEYHFDSGPYIAF
uniref:BTB domain-containing protein n=1 Tax=Mycena chlorophos TaxID=658473 RepID=A0ABQ0M4D4_MYCCL|nr:predicted protein [Mycena chlorophos]